MIACSSFDLSDASSAYSGLGSARLSYLALVIEARKTYSLSRLKQDEAEGSLVVSFPADLIPNLGYKCAKPNSGGREQLVTKLNNARRCSWSKD